MRHANATAAISSGAGLGAILWLLGAVGVSIPEPPLPVSVVLGSLASSLVLAIGRRGIRGIARMIWRGRE